MTIFRYPIEFRIKLLQTNCKRTKGVVDPIYLDEHTGKEVKKFKTYVVWNESRRDFSLTINPLLPLEEDFSETRKT